MQCAPLIFLNESLNDTYYMIIDLRFVMLTIVLVYLCMYRQHLFSIVTFSYLIYMLLNVFHF